MSHKVFIFFLLSFVGCLSRCTWGSPMHPVSTFEIFFSQQSITNPCTGFPITFDFGYFKMELSRSVDVLSGYVTFQQTMRHDKELYSQKNQGTFDISVPSNESDYESILRYDVPKSSFNMIYIFDFALTTNDVQGVQLQEIQVGKC